MGIDTRTAGVALAAILLLAGSFFAVVIFAPGSGMAKETVDAVAVLFAMLSVLALLRMRLFLLGVNRAWAGHISLIALGFTLWLLAEGVWGYYDVALPSGSPGITVADAFWLVGYGLIIAGLAMANGQTRIAFKPRDTLYAAAFGAFALAVAGFVLLPLLSAPMDPLQKSISLAYPVFDVAIVALTLRLAMAFIGSPLGATWTVFLLGFIVLAFSDAWSAYLTLANTYYPGHLYDFTYPSSYIIIGAGALLFVVRSGAGLVKGAEGEKGEPPAVEKAHTQLKDALFRKKAEDAVAITTAISPSDADVAVLEFLAKEKKMGGVFLCLDRPHTYYLGQFADLGIAPGSVHFITIGTGPAQDNVSFVDGAGDLTAIKIALDEAVKRMKEKYGKVFVLVDCIPTLSLYNNLSHLGMFLHDLNLALRGKEAYQVLLLAPNGEINTFVLRFSDTNISLA